MDLNFLKTFVLGGAHQLRTLQQTLSDVRAEIDPVLSQCSGRITELYKLEKEIWETVDFVTERCQAMKRQVDETTEEQVTSSFYFHNVCTLCCARDLIIVLLWVVVYPMFIVCNVSMNGTSAHSNEDYRRELVMKIFILLNFWFRFI